MARSLLNEYDIEVVAKRETGSMAVDVGIFGMNQSAREQREDLMITVKNQFLQLTLSAITFVVVIGALSMIWPAIIALFLGVLLLLQSLGVEQEMVVLSWAEVGHVPVVVASLRRPGLPEMLS